MAEAAHSMSSSAREKMLERLLVGELQKHLWKSGHYNLEVLHAETDKAGYDIVLELNGVLRHVQLKTSFIGSKTARVNIGVKLASKPAGCVIWTWFHPQTLELDHFLFFGSSAGGRLPNLGDRVARHTKANHLGEKSERPNLRVLNKGRFEKLSRIDDVSMKLFGV